MEKEGLPPALLGSCNERAKQLHASPSGRACIAFGGFSRLKTYDWIMILKCREVVDGTGV